MNSEDYVSSDQRSPEAEIERLLRGVRHILVPMDLAQDSLRTIAYGIRLGQHFGSRLTLLHVYQPPIAFGIPSWELWKYRTLEGSTRSGRDTESARRFGARRIPKL